VETGRTPNKWHRDRHLDKKGCQKLKEWERLNGGGEMLEGPGMQNGNKGPKHKLAASS
jgi:hypothetical protein